MKVSFPNKTALISSNKLSGAAPASPISSPNYTEKSWHENASPVGQFFHAIQFQGRKSTQGKPKAPSEFQLPPLSECATDRELLREIAKTQLRNGLTNAIQYAPLYDFQATLKDFVSGLLISVLGAGEVIAKLQEHSEDLIPESKFYLEMFLSILSPEQQAETFITEPVFQLLTHHITDTWMSEIETDHDNRALEKHEQAQKMQPDTKKTTKSKKNNENQKALLELTAEAASALLNQNGFSTQGIEFNVEGKPHVIQLSPLLKQVLSGFKIAFSSQYNRTFRNFISYVIEIAKKADAPEELKNVATLFQNIQRDFTAGIQSGKLTLAQESDSPKALRKKLDTLYDGNPLSKTNKMSPAQYRIAFSLLKELEKTDPTSPSYPILSNRLHTILHKLPWDGSPVIPYSEESIQAALAKEHAGLTEAKEAITEHLAQEYLIEQLTQAGKYTASGKPLLILLKGSPGTGKTSLGKAIAEASNRRFIRISLGGLHDEAEIRGHRSAYTGATVGRIIQALIDSGTNNPVIMLDEIDKLGKDHRGDPASALLEVLDPEQNRTFRDNYLGMEVDLSKCVFIANANSLHTIPEALKDRFQVIQIHGYTLSEKITIAKEHLLRRARQTSGLQKENFNLSEEPFQLSEEVLEAIIRDYAPEQGVRSLERYINQIAKKLAAKIAGKSLDTITADDFPTITTENLERFLGTPEMLPLEQVDPTPVTGQVHGLYYSDNESRSGGTTDVGVILHERTETDPAKTGLTLGQITGGMADIMKESAQRAFSYVKGHAKELGIDLSNRTIEVEIHSGDLIPKDGPSAGAALTLSLISGLTNRPIPGDFALTGEFGILGGKILPIGGLREKIAGAVEEGVKRIAIPKANIPHLKNIPPEILSQVEIIPVGTMAELINVVWPPTQSGTNTPPVTFSGNRSKHTSQTNVQTLHRKPFSQFA